VIIAFKNATLYNLNIMLEEEDLELFVATNGNSADGGLHIVDAFSDCLDNPNRATRYFAHGQPYELVTGRFEGQEQAVGIEVRFGPPHIVSTSRELLQLLAQDGVVKPALFPWSFAPTSRVARLFEQRNTREQNSVPTLAGCVLRDRLGTDASIAFEMDEERRVVLNPMLQRFLQNPISRDFALLAAIFTRDGSSSIMTFEWWGRVAVENSPGIPQVLDEYYRVGWTHSFEDIVPYDRELLVRNGFSDKLISLYEVENWFIEGH